MTQAEDGKKADRRLARMVRAAQKARIENARALMPTVAADLRARHHPRRWFAERRQTAYDFVNWALSETDKKPMGFQLQAADLIERVYEIRAECTHAGIGVAKICPRCLGWTGSTTM